MARTIAQIQAAIIAAKEADSNLSGLTSTSRVAMWRLWTYIVAVCQWTLEVLYDQHKQEVKDIIALQRPHTRQWYAAKAKAYQHGMALPADSDAYAVIDESLQIVKQASPVETPDAVNAIRLKVAKEVGGDLGPLSTPELDGFKGYMALCKDAGVRLIVTSGVADDLRTQLMIYYNPLILDAAGARLDGTAATPVKDAIKSFLKNDVPFDGLFLPNKLRDAMENVEGVVIAELVYTICRFGTNPYLPVLSEYNPDAGYLRLDDAWFDTNTDYTPHLPIG
jgi:hypothetical protein